MQIEAMSEEGKAALSEVLETIERRYPGMGSDPALCTSTEDLIMVITCYHHAGESGRERFNKAFVELEARMQQSCEAPVWRACCILLDYALLERMLTVNSGLQPSDALLCYLHDKGCGSRALDHVRGKRTFVIVPFSQGRSSKYPEAVLSFHQSW